MSSQPVVAPPRSPADAIPDVQGAADRRQIAIDRVGVKEVTYPLRLKQKDGQLQHTVAKINMYVSLPHTQKGTHMSRFLEVLNAHEGAVSPQDLPAITEMIRERLHSDDAHFEAEFTYFIKKFAPVTRQPGLMDYRVRFSCSRGAKNDFVMTVAAPATSLCPCSKEISIHGAHNQRCLIEASVRMDEAKPILWIEDLVQTLEGAASEQLYAVLKRPDEKHVTEGAYENPKFVEDIVRDLALSLEKDDRIAWYSINSENFESIHSHNAYAKITRDKRA